MQETMTELEDGAVAEAVTALKKVLEPLAVLWSVEALVAWYR